MKGSETEAPGIEMTGPAAPSSVGWRTHNFKHGAQKTKKKGKGLHKVEDIMTAKSKERKLPPGNLEQYAACTVACGWLQTSFVIFKSALVSP